MNRESRGTSSGRFATMLRFRIRLQEATRLFATVRARSHEL